MNRRAVLAVFAIGAVLPARPGAGADGQPFHKTAGNYSVYLAVMPTEIVRGPLAPEIPGASLQRAPAARDTHQVMVSIFDARTGLRVNGLQVKARVAALGFSGERRALEATSVAGATVYMNGFPMLGRGPFRVDVEFGAPGNPHSQHVRFYFTHPSFAAPGHGAQEGEAK